MKIIQVVASILVPPLGVFLVTGISTSLIINILLTLLGWIPGVIHALWILSKQSEQANA
ncbi:MAG: YqaE/Pmp3 family membrane protein [Xenococcaceae cyanobacterium MO_207.B15]|nr:YqaE/Pmp3 family membrane protein [Xenococcaceae cyanobacterium MO_207.B15]MDJ0746894.1 YqaE/Pmp3 family membrane protein [Xenococcaceae cyanobacterium MO_167.B27]